MYNEEKKIITDIGRKKNLEENLPKYVSCMKSADMRCPSLLLTSLLSRKCLRTRRKRSNRRS